MCHRERSDLRVDGVAAPRSKASQWAATYVAPPMLMSERFLVGGFVAFFGGIVLLFVALVAHSAFDARDWPDAALAGALILAAGGVVTLLVSLECGAAKGRRCELACYGDGEKELACVSAKGELVSHLDGRSLAPHEAVRLGWWIVDTFSDTTPSNVGLPQSVGGAQFPQGVAGQIL